MVLSVSAGIGDRWKNLIEASPDYIVVPHDNRFRMGLYSSAVGESEYTNLGKVLAGLLSAYDGFTIEECIPGRECSGEEGTCYCTESFIPCNLPGILQNRIRSALISELRLVRGIGVRKSEILTQKGCKSIEDLQYQRKFAHLAQGCLDAIRSGPSATTPLIRSRLGPSHPLHLMVSGQYEPERFRFIDIETLGLFGRPVILFGIGFFKGENLCIQQILLRDISEELPALMEVQRLLRGDTVLISYNGKSFDLPSLSERFQYYGLPGLGGIPHYDLLHFVRRFWKRSGYDCRLSTIEEKFLGIKREFDLPGMLVPEWYALYQETGNPGPVIPIMKHNHQDVASLALLFSSLRGMADGCC